MKSYITAMIKKRRARAVYRELLSMDDRMLADLGMNRLDLQALSRSNPSISSTRN